MIRLVIKGHRFEASAKASSLGIPFAFKSESNVNRSPYVNDGKAIFETVGECPDGFLSSVLRWFQEPSHCVKGRGYDVGTLLWYQVPEWVEPIEA